MTPNSSGATDKFFTDDDGTYFREKEIRTSQRRLRLSFCKIQVYPTREKHEGAHLDWTDGSYRGEVLR
jgi:hypothetical protein